VLGPWFALALVGVVPESAPLGLNVAQFFTPMVEREIRSPDFTKGVLVLQESIVDERGRLFGNRVHMRIEQLGLNVSEAESVVVWPEHAIGFRRFLSEPAIDLRVEISRIAGYNDKVAASLHLVSGRLPIVDDIDRCAVEAVHFLLNPARFYRNVSPQLPFCRCPSDKRVRDFREAAQC
jgi:hypothetical protein